MCALFINKVNEAPGIFGSSWESQMFAASGNALDFGNWVTLIFYDGTMRSPVKLGEAKAGMNWVGKKFDQGNRGRGCQILSIITHLGFGERKRWQ